MCIKVLDPKGREGHHVSGFSFAMKSNARIIRIHVTSEVLHI